jgi:hypothetical protein
MRTGQIPSSLKEFLIHAAAAGALKEAWAASAMGANSLKYRPEAHYMRGPGPKWFAKHVSTRNFERL